MVADALRNRAQRDEQQVLTHETALVHALAHVLSAQPVQMAAAHKCRVAASVARLEQQASEPLDRSPVAALVARDLDQSLHRHAAAHNRDGNRADLSADRKAHRLAAAED